MSGNPILCVKLFINIRLNKCASDTNVLFVLTLREWTALSDPILSQYWKLTTNSNNYFMLLLIFYFVFSSESTWNPTRTEWKGEFLRRTRRRRLALSKGRELNPPIICNDVSKSSILLTVENNLFFNHPRHVCEHYEHNHNYNVLLKTILL